MMRGGEGRGLGFLVLQTRGSRSSCLRPFSKADVTALAPLATAQWPPAWDPPPPRAASMLICFWFGP